MKKRYNNHTRSPVMRKGGRVSMKSGDTVRMTLPDISILRKLPIAELRKLLISVGQGAGMSDPGHKTIAALIKTKQSQGAR